MHRNADETNLGSLRVFYGKYFFFRIDDDDSFCASILCVKSYGTCNKQTLHYTLYIIDVYVYVYVYVCAHVH